MDCGETLKKPCKTTVFMTRFELARLVGLYLLEFPSTLPMDEAIEDARRKIVDGQYDAIIRRPVNDGYEDVHVSTLRTTNLQ